MNIRLCSPNNESFRISDLFVVHVFNFSHTRPYGHIEIFDIDNDELSYFHYTSISFDFDSVRIYLPWEDYYKAFDSLYEDIF